MKIPKYNDDLKARAKRVSLDVLQFLSNDRCAFLVGANTRAVFSLINL